MQFFSCFMLCFSFSQIIYSDLKYIFYVFINAVEHWETPENSFMGVQGRSDKGRSDKEIKKKKYSNFFYSILHYISHFDFFQNPWCHCCRKDDRRKIEMLNQKTLQVYNFRWVFYLFSWRHLHVLYKQIHLSLTEVLKTCSNFSSLRNRYFFAQECNLLLISKKSSFMYSRSCVNQ